MAENFNRSDVVLPILTKSVAGDGLRKTPLGSGRRVRRIPDDPSREATLCVYCGPTTRGSAMEASQSRMRAGTTYDSVSELLRRTWGLFARASNQVEVKCAMCHAVQSRPGLAGRRATPRGSEGVQDRGLSWTELERGDLAGSDWYTIRALK